MYHGEVLAILDADQLKTMVNIQLVQELHLVLKFRMNEEIRSFDFVQKENLRNFLKFTLHTLSR